MFVVIKYWFSFIRDIPETYPHSGQNTALLAVWSSAFHERILLFAFKVSMWFFLLTLEALILIWRSLEYWNKIVVDTTTSTSKLNGSVIYLFIYFCLFVYVKAGVTWSVRFLLALWFALLLNIIYVIFWLTFWIWLQTFTEIYMMLRLEILDGEGNDHKAFKDKKCTDWVI